MQLEKYENGTISRKDKNSYDCSFSSDLNCPIPFDINDKILIDCRPYAPVKEGLIVEKINNDDCCGIQVACEDEKTKEIQIKALKHSHMFHNNYVSRLSPLYRLKRLEK